jgi:hypothetical protein
MTKELNLVEVFKNTDSFVDWVCNTRSELLKKQELQQKTEKNENEPKKSTGDIKRVQKTRLLDVAITESQSNPKRIAPSSGKERDTRPSKKAKNTSDVVRSKKDSKIISQQGEETEETKRKKRLQRFGPVDKSSYEPIDGTRTKPKKGIRRISGNANVKVTKDVSKSEPIREIRMLEEKLRFRHENRQSENAKEKSKDQDGNLSNININHTEASPTKAQSTQKPRCVFFPACTKGAECPFFHPTEPCKNFPHCSFGNKCRYIHPQCKFGSRCTRPGCAYFHPPEARVDCKNGFACTLRTTSCPYRHPPVGCYFGYSCRNKGKCMFSHEKRCKFGTACTIFGCLFAHQLPHQEGENNVLEENTEQLSETLPKTPPKNEQDTTTENA